MDSTRILPVFQSAPSGTGATTIIPASGNAERYRHLASLLITTAGTVADVLTLSDGTKTVALINYPVTAAAPLQPFIWQPSDLVQQSAPNAAWTITPGTTGNTYEVTAQYCEN